MRDRRHEQWNQTEAGFFKEAFYPFKFERNFSTSGSNIESSSNTTGSQKVFITLDSIRDVLRFKPVIIHEEYKLSYYPVDILSFDNVFPETYVAQELIFKSKRTGIFFNLTMAVDHGWKNVKKLHGVNKWYMTETKDFIWNISFEIKT